MSDRSTNQTLRAAFAELRAAEQPRICPPGPAAARRTVRRHRIGAVSATAGLTALVAISVTFLAGAGGQAPPRATTAPQAAAEASTEVVPDRQQAELDHITVNALGEPPAGARLAAIAGGRLRDGARPPGQLRLWSVASGTYLLRISCGDPGGSVTIGVRAGGAEATGTARCGAAADEVAAGIGEVTVVATGPDPAVQIRVQPDDAALADGVWPVIGLVLTPR